MSFDGAALNTAPASSTRVLLPCRSCYTPTVASQLRPYRYLSRHAFSSDFAHSHSLCPDCDYWLHPNAARSDAWELVDGKDKFCRLCGDGDRSITAVVCDEDGCTFAFCILCIRANGGERMLREVCCEGRWVCFNHSERPPDCSARLLDSLDLVCRAERGQFSHRNVYDCFSAITHKPVPSFTYLTPKAKQRWHQTHQPPLPPSHSPKRLLSTCLYKWTSSAPRHHVKYVYGLMENMHHFLERWPGWTLRLYYDNSIILPAAAPEDELDHVHSQSEEPPPADAADNSQYTRSLADAFRLLLATFCNHPSIELVWFNFPYLQDRSHHHHGHVGMAARFLALADLGVTATHVVVADLDNLWHDTARMQAEHFEAGKRYHRYHDIDYVFPLAGGSFNARVERIQPERAEASPFADIESHLHAFFTAHHRAPEELRDKYGDRVDESESIAPTAAITQQRDGKRGRAEHTLHTGSSEQRGKSQRVALRTARDNHPLLDVRVSETVDGVEEGQDEVSDDSEEEKDGVSLFTSGRRLSDRISAAREQRKEAEKAGKRAERERVRQQQLQQQQSRSLTAACSSIDAATSSDSINERRDLHHYFFGYSCDQVFLQETVWPVIKQSCATTVVQLEHIKQEIRDRNKQEEAAVVKLDCDAQPSRCDEDEHDRRQLVRCRARERSRWRVQRQKRLFKHYFGMVDERDFPQHHGIRDWLSKRVREVWSHWRHHCAAATTPASGSSRRSGSWQPRVDPPASLDIHCLVTAPHHFSGADVSLLARYTPHFAPPAAAAYIGPPSATSPVDFDDRWTAQQDDAQQRCTEQRKADLPSAHRRQLSFSRADAPHTAPSAPRLPARPAVSAAASVTSTATAATHQVIDVSGADSEDESDILCSMMPVYHC